VYLGAKRRYINTLLSFPFLSFTGSQLAGDRKSSTRRLAAITFRQACSYLPSRRASPPFGRYHVILLGDRGQRHIGVNNLPKVVT